MYYDNMILIREPIKKKKGVVLMFEFKEEMVVTGVVNKTSKKGNEYVIVNYLGQDGQTFGTMAECNLPNLNQLDRVLATFKLTPGKYIQLKTIDIEKIA